MQNRAFFNRWSALEVLFAFLFIAAPLYYHPNIGGTGLRIPNNNIVWAVMSIIIWLSFLKILNKNKYTVPREFIYFVAFPLLITISAFFIGIKQPIDWAVRVLFIWGGVALFFSFFQHDLKQGRIDRLLFVLVISAQVQALIGLSQFVFGDTTLFFIPGSAGQASGSFQQINNQASYQVTCLAISLYLISRPFVRTRVNLKRFLFFSLIFSSFIVGLSGSRVGAFSFIFCLVGFSFLNSSRHRKGLRLALLIITASFLLGMYTNDYRVVGRTLELSSDYTGSARGLIYNISIELIKEKPVFGHGIGTFDNVWQSYKPNFYFKKPDSALLNSYVHHPHNEILLWLVEGGAIALSGILFFMYGVIKALGSCGVSRGGASALMLLPISIHTQVELPFYLSSLHWCLFLFLISNVCRQNVYERAVKISKPASVLAKITLHSFFIISLFAVGHTLRSHIDFTNYYKQESNAGNSLSYALNNFFLSEVARHVEMSSILYSSIAQKDAKGVEAFIEWSQVRIKERQDLKLYWQISDAYFFLGDRDSFCNSIIDGLAIYPEEKTLTYRQESYCGKK